MQNHLLSYRDNLRVEVEPGIPVAARTVAELRALSTWPGPLGLKRPHLPRPTVKRDDGETSVLI
jgi:hypothetical protein